MFLWTAFSYTQIESTLKLKNNVSLEYPAMEITTLNNPSQDYLFLDLTTGGIGNLMIVDNELTPVFYRKVSGIIYDFKYQPDGELTFSIGPSTIFGMDSSGKIINQFFAPPGITLDIHELRVMSDGTYFILGEEYLNIDMSQYVQGGDTAAILVTHNIIHMNANDNEIWRWRTIDHYDILDTDQYVNLTQHQIDWTHCNSLDIDNEGNILLSTRNFDEVTKINGTTGDIIWRLGGEKNQFTFINDIRGFSRQHCVRWMSNGDVIMFDNGHYLLPEYSSVVEYRIDETNFTATLVRRYTHNDAIFSRVLGSVQELSNNNILIGWGDSQNPAITEINDQDSIEFELKFLENARQYRIYRFKWETNLFTISSDSIDFGSTSVGDSSFAELILYNSNDSLVTINECFADNFSFSILNALPISIPPHDSITLVIIFKPEVEGYYHDKLNIRFVTDTLLLGKQVNLVGETTLVSVEDKTEAPLQFSLSQNYPNPFNSSTKISWELQRSSYLTLKVFDVLGNEVATLINEFRPAGKYDVDFNAALLPSGVYFYQLKAINSELSTAQDFLSTKKMILLK